MRTTPERVDQVVELMNTATQDENALKQQLIEQGFAKSARGAEGYIKAAKATGKVISPETAPTPSQPIFKLKVEGGRLQTITPINSLTSKVVIFE